MIYMERQATRGATAYVFAIFDGPTKGTIFPCCLFIMAGLAQWLPIPFIPEEIPIVFVRLNMIHHRC
jgi:hypothetical protein